MLISRLWVVVLIQIVLGLESQVRGTNIIVGMMIFSIEGDLGFERSLFRM